MKLVSGAADLVLSIFTDEQTFVLRAVQPGLAGLMDGSRYRCLSSGFATSCLQIIVGGGLVFASGVLIGQS